MPKIIDRSLPLTDFIDKLIPELSYRHLPIGRAGRWTAVIVETSGGKAVAHVRDSEFHLDVGFKDKYLKPLTDALEKYEKKTSVETTIVIERL